MGIGAPFEPMPPPPPQTHVDLYWWGDRIFLEQDVVEKVTGDASEASEELIETRRHASRRRVWKRHASPKAAIGETCLPQPVPLQRPEA